MRLKLSVLQQQLLLHSLLLRQYPRIYTVEMLIGFEKTLAAPAARKLITELIQRRPLLAARIQNIDGSAFFEIETGLFHGLIAEYTVPDLAALRAVCETLAVPTGRPGDDLVHFALFQVIDLGQSVLYVSGHHLLLDGATCAYLVQDISDILQAKPAGELALEHPDKALDDFIQTRQLRNAELPLPKQKALPDRNRSGGYIHALLLEDQQTLRLEKIAQQSHMFLGDVLVGVFFASAAAVTPTASDWLFSLDMRYLIPSLQGQYGHMVDQVPVRLTPGLDWRAAARHYRQKTLVASMRHVPGQLTAWPAPALNINFYDEKQQTNPDGIAWTEDVELARDYSIFDFSASIRRSSSDNVHCEIGYTNAYFNRQTAQDILNEFATNLKKVATNHE